MSIDIEKILKLIAGQPGIRTVEIADLVDCEPDQVQPALQSRIDSGEIIMHPVVAPNGKAANGFELKCAPAPEPVVVEVDASGPGVRTKIDAAIEYVTEHGSAVSAQLRLAMGLDASEYPSSYLRPAITDGRLRKIGQNYLPGNKPAQEKPRRAAPARRGAGAARRAVPKAEPAHIPAALPEFRCAIWSDGALELRRGDQTIAMLTAAEQQAVRMLQDRVKA